MSTEINEILENNLGARLLAAFKEGCGLTDKQVIAEKLGYKSKQSVYQIIDGSLGLNAETLRLFRNATGYSIDWLLTGESEKRIDPVFSEENLTRFVRKIVRQELNAAKEIERNEDRPQKSSPPEAAKKLRKTELIVPELGGR